MKTIIVALLFSAFLAVVCPVWSALLHAAADLGHFEFILPPVEGGDIEP
jgi:hypothetical protein